MLETINLPIISTATLIPLPDQYVVKKAYCNFGNRNMTVSMIDVVDKLDNKRRKILSAGKNRYGVLGQGEDVKESNMFKEIKLNFNLVTITNIEMSGKHAIAQTRDG